MNPIEFLKKALGELSIKFPSVHIKYGFNKTIATHIVELLPLSEYESNEDLLESWLPISFDFREQFYNEEISFVSSDSPLSILNPELEFNVPKPVDCFLDISSFYEPISQQAFDYTFPDYMPVVAINIGVSLCEVFKYPKQKIEVDTDINNYYQSAA